MTEDMSEVARTLAAQRRVRPKKCAWTKCRGSYEGMAHGQYCSANCRIAAWRARKRDEREIAKRRTPASDLKGAVLEEREACAEVASSFYQAWEGIPYQAGQAISRAILARKGRDKGETV